MFPSLCVLAGGRHGDRVFGHIILSVRRHLANESSKLINDGE